MQKFLKTVLIGLQAIGIPANRRELWIGFVFELTNAPQLAFINELLNILSVFKDGMRSSEQVRLNQCARNMIEWSWRVESDRPNFDRTELVAVVTGRTLPTVLQTLSSSPKASTTLIEKILKRIGSAGASSRELFWLANDMNLVIDFSPSLAAGIYETVYGYKENSEKEVSISSGSVLNLVTSERQQYEGLFYQLGARFPNFLKKDFVLAARTAVRITNSEVLRERPLSEHERLANVGMRVAHHSVSYVPDYSEIWDAGGGRDYTSLQMFDSVLRFAHESAEGAHARLLVETILAEGSVAVIFKKLFEDASRSVRLYSNVLKEALLSARFISAPEITIAVGQFIEQLKVTEANDRELWQALEATVLRIPRSKPILRYERPRSIQIRLLSSFRELLRDPRALAILDSTREPRPNRLFCQISGGAVNAGSPEIYRLRGIDPEDPTNRNLIDATEAVKKFAYRSPNVPASLVEAEASFPDLVHLKEVIRQSDTASDDLLVNARGTLFAAVSAMSLVKDIRVDSPLFDFMLAEAIEGSNDPAPVFDPKYHLPFDNPGWGSPTPRIEAAQALVNLVWNHRGDRRALPAFLRLMDDPVPAVRFQIARGLVALYVREDSRDEFWTYLGKMLQKETTNGVALGLLQSLSQIAGREPVRAMSVLSRYIAEGYRQSKKSDVMRSVIGIAAGLYLAQGTPEARTRLRDFEQDLEKNHRELSQMVLVAGQHITSADGTEVERARAREIWDAVLDSVLKRSQQLFEQPPPRDFNAVVRVLDTLISRLFFSFDLIGTRAPDQNALDHEGRRVLFDELKSFIDRLVQADDIEHDRDVPLIPHTAHYFLQLMNGILEYAPDQVLRYAFAICSRGARTGYLEDSMARAEAVKLVERAIADFRDRLKQPSVASSVAGMLDLFTKHAWSEAVTLTFRLEDAFR
jgi:hypothetical protein